MNLQGSILRSIARRIALVLSAGMLVFLTGCASIGANPHDPLEPVNRKVWQFNDALDRAVLKPVATGYRDHVPSPIRTGVSNFFGNLGDAWSFVNNVLQFKLQDAEESFARVHINTFFGLGGIFDVASDLNIPKHRKDFGQTLGRWGAPPGPYLVLPFFGPSTLRDTLAMPVDQWGDPVHYFQSVDVRNSMFALRVVDTRANLLRASALLEGAALDPYSFTRDAYLQYRRSQILDGEDGSDSSGEEPPPAEPEGQPPAPSSPGAAQPAAPAENVQTPAAVPAPQEQPSNDARQPLAPQQR